MIKFGDNKIVSNPGSRYRTLYSSKVLGDGSIILTESGKEDTFEMIQSFESSTDMSIILAKLASGDVSVINRSSPMFGDFTTAPRSLAEALQLKIDSDKVFDSLPVEIKQKFDNSRDKFFASAGSEDWYSKLSISPDRPIEDLTLEKEVSKDGDN